MKVILVDDEPLSLDLFKFECGNMPGFEVVGFFDNSADALAYAQDNPVDFALLDIDMPEMTGIELARRLRLARPGMIIIFVTAHPEYAADAIHAKADFVVFKPYEREDIIDALERARLLSERQKKRIRFRTFGHFDMFVDGRLVNFKSAKAKELLALCVSRMGGEVTIHEMVDVLWANTGDQGLGYRTTIKALSDTLKEVGAGEILRRKRSVLAVDPDAFDCDLLDFKAGKSEARGAFHGEFMQ
ncbi:MAG: response regulator [Clostridia bacterium]|nr:response regulator [Clostridia bacterium]